MAGLEEFIKGVNDKVGADIADSIDDPDSVQALKRIISEAIICNRKLLPSTEVKNDKKASVEKFTNKIVNTKSTNVSAYHLFWADWKENNQQGEYPDPENPEQKLSAHKYWKRYIWDNLGKDDPEKLKYWEEMADGRRQVMGKKEKRTVATSSFQLFIKKMKSKMDPEETFTHPEDGKNIKLHKYLLYIWSEYIKNNDELVRDFKEMADRLKKGEISDYDLDELPYLDVDKVRNGDFDDLEMIPE